MKLQNKILAAIFLIMLAAFAGTVSAADENSGSEYLTITGVSSDPAVFMYGDTGTVTVKIKNTGTTSVNYQRADLFSKDISVLNDDAYDTAGFIGGGNEIEFVFYVKATSNDGIYYPRFYLDMKGTGSVSHNVPVKIENTGLVVSALNAPDYYQEGISKKINVLVGNPRENAVSGVTVTVKGDVTTTQTSRFIGALAADASATAEFEVTPTSEGTMTFEVSYKNGMTTHTSELTLPIVYGTSKVSPNPIITNVKVTDSGAYKTLSGDVNNAGIEDAKSMVITVASPAVPVDPYKSSVIGSLDSDDFSSFEITFRCDSDEVPVLITFKDASGNTYTKTDNIKSNSQDIFSAESAAGESRGQFPPNGGGRGMDGIMRGMGGGSLPITEIIILIIIAGAVAVAWKKGYLTKVTDAINKQTEKKN
ncbi:MAG: DUF11 domain-containing protein [Methanomicrobium sp.]|nr:DUF11 domain-containing protein [Methanomicrobium sp.]